MTNYSDQIVDIIKYINIYIFIHLIKKQEQDTGFLFIINKDIELYIITKYIVQYL